jgi:hypothetical protein
MNNLLTELLAKVPAIASEVTQDATETIAALNIIKQYAQQAQVWTAEHDAALVAAANVATPPVAQNNAAPEGSIPTA